MSDMIDQRRASYEAKHALDQETSFKIESRRNKLLGLWLAERLGRPESEHEEYAKSVVIADLEEPGIEDILRKVMKDIGDAGADISEQDIRVKLDELFEVAAAQITGD